jgi:uncharacterized protein (UPF0371 family)
VICEANKKFAESGRECIALQLENGKIVTGKATNLLSAASSVVLNAIKELAGVDDGVYLLGDGVLEPVCDFKRKIYGDNGVRLNLYDVLSALALCAKTNILAQKAYSKLSELAYTEAHSSHILDQLFDQSVGFGV